MGEQRGGMGEQGEQMPMPGGPLTKQKILESFKGLMELLPGIPDSITLTHVAPKLPWRAVRILSLVSAAWQQAVHSREVYQARIRSGSTETFVLLSHTLKVCDELVHAISLYSMEDKRCYQLPAIPGLKERIPGSCRCICLDGKVYILGGESKTFDLNSSKEVYKLDVAGKWEWKRCADMQQGRMRFGCVVMNEQIYVLGGRSSDKRMHESEVYDPKADAWSSILPMMKSRFPYLATALGEDIVVHRGDYNDDYDPRYNRATGDKLKRHVHSWFDMEVYHSGRNEWRVVVPRGNQPKHLGRPFLGHGKFHSMIGDRIYVFDIGMDKYTMTDLHSSSFKELGPIEWGPVAQVVRAVNGELLALAECWSSDTDDYNNIFLLQSRGFGGENRELVWEKAACSLTFEDLRTALVCPIQL